MKSLKIIGTIFALIGLIVIIVGICLSTANSEFMKTANFAEGIITDVTSYRDSDGDTHRTVYVAYEVDGIRYEDTTSFTSSSMREGKKIKIYYNPDLPSDFRVEGETVFEAVFPIAFGGIFFIVGMSLVVPGVIHSINQNKVKQQGELIEAEIDDIDVNYGYTVNGRHPYIINCSWKDHNTGELYQFRSNNLWFDPEKLLDGKKTIQVYVNMQKPKIYYVDTSELEKLVKN